MAGGGGNQSGPLTLILHLEDVTTSTAIDLGSCVLSGEPYNIDVDWCDGSEVKHYEGTSGQPTIKHTYSTAGNQQIKITGNFGWYGNGSSFGLLRSYLVGIEIKNSSPLTRVSDCAFYYYQKLRTIDGKMFENCVNQTQFYSTFSNCSNLTTIPSGLFDKNTKVTLFKGTFVSTPVLDPPYDLFKYNTAITEMVALGESQMTHMTIIPVNDYAQPSYFTPFGYAKCCEKLYIWNCMSQDRMSAFIEDLPPAEEGITHTLYLAVTPGVEKQGITSLSEPNEIALTAKGWTFGGLVK